MGHALSDGVKSGEEAAAVALELWEGQKAEARVASSCKGGDVVKSHVTAQEFGREVAREQERHEAARFVHLFFWTE